VSCLSDKRGDFEIKKSKQGQLKMKAKPVRPLALDDAGQGEHSTSQNALLAEQVESMQMRIESLTKELAKPADVILSEVVDALDGQAVIFDGLGVRVRHVLNEMDNWIERAGELERILEAARCRLACVADSMTNHAYQEIASALESPSAADGAKLSEADRLRKLFDEAGQGEHNVLALIDYYQRNSIDADERLQAVRRLVEEIGCDCPCEHHAEERAFDCEICLACKILEALRE
jgi:hypothetical protein